MTFLLEGLRPELLLPSLPPLSDGAGVLVAEVEVEVMSEMALGLLEVALPVVVVELLDSELVRDDEVKVVLDVLVDVEVEVEDEVLVAEVDDEVVNVDEVKLEVEV